MNEEDIDDDDYIPGKFDEQKAKDQYNDFSGLFNKLKLYLEEYYLPVQDPKDAEFHYTTQEIHQQLLQLFPNELILTKDIVAIMLHNAGFTFYDYGEMKLEWMMKKA